MCAHNASGHGIGCQAVRTSYIYGDKHSSTLEAIQISPPNFSEGGLLRSRINISFTYLSGYSFGAVIRVQLPPLVY